MSEVTELNNKMCGYCAHFDDGKCRSKKKEVGFFQTQDCFVDRYALKVCKRCGRELPLDSFGGHNRTPDHKQPICKECMSASLKGTKKARKSKGLEMAVEVKPEPKPEAPVKAPKDEAKIDLSRYSSEEILTELRRRGFTGTLTITI